MSPDASQAYAGEDLASPTPGEIPAALPDDAAITALKNLLAHGKGAAKEDDGEKGGTGETPAAEASGAGNTGGGGTDEVESEATGEFAADRLRSFIERIERLDEEKQALMADIREIFAEAKGNGFDVKVIRSILRLRKLETSDREEQDALLDLYRSTLGV